METVYELSRLLNTGLDRDTLAILMALIQKGVNPEALAAVVKDLRKDAAEQQQQQQTEAPRERTFTGGKQPLSTQELQKKRRSDY
ncbi:mitotic-spindle organizing protein [Phytophthora cinnamomi]|uniref:mitotic-spindle organizing protein n=1 Tax=Phytophthora cinnamomi TaxID=4785 RepID=UPI00355A6296|nr:mitotic-spindle organizing protein [Phytophthora cinnamomi]